VSDFGSNKAESRPNKLNLGFKKGQSVPTDGSRGSDFFRKGTFHIRKRYEEVDQSEICRRIDFSEENTVLKG
jgi:hypothetical protein